MDQSNDDLQNAINGIVSGSNAATPEVATPEMPDLGVPPTPPVPEAGASLDMALPGVAPETPETAPGLTPEPGADLMNQAPASIEEQAAAEMTTPPEVAPDFTPGITSEAPEMAPETAPADLADSVIDLPETTPETPSELSSVKQSMIQDLIPLMDKVSLDANKKFDLYKEVIDSTHDKSMVPAAYEVAKGISDDTLKAEALLYLINESEQ